MHRNLLRISQNRVLISIPKDLTCIELKCVNNLDVKISDSSVWDHNSPIVDHRSLKCYTSGSRGVYGLNYRYLTNSVPGWLLGHYYMCLALYCHMPKRRAWLHLFGHATPFFLSCITFTLGPGTQGVFHTASAAYRNQVTPYWSSCHKRQD